MKIRTIRLYQVNLPIAGAGYQLSRDRLVTETLNTIVEVVTDDDITGWGESCPFGANYLQGFAGGALAVLKTLCPLLIGRDPREIDVINRIMDEALTGHIYAKAAIDIACWDVLGKATGLPFYVLLGGMSNPDPVVRSSVNTAGGVDLADGIAAKRADGFRVLTLKVGDDAIADADVTHAVAAHTQPGERLVVDANGGWVLHDALTFVHKIADVPGVLIEQPCMSLADCLAVAAKAGQPVVLDESIDDIEVLAGLLSAKKTAAVNLKIERIGGITKTRQMRDLCLAAGCAMFVQEVGGAEISYAATTHLAHTIPSELLLGASTLKVARSLAAGAPILSDGHVRCNDQPGLGIIIRTDALGDPTDVFK